MRTCSWASCAPRATTAASPSARPHVEPPSPPRHGSQRVGRRVEMGRADLSRCASVRCSGERPVAHLLRLRPAVAWGTHPARHRPRCLPGELTRRVWARGLPASETHTHQPAWRTSRPQPPVPQPLAYGATPGRETLTETNGQRETGRVTNPGRYRPVSLPQD
jgi:hypothetical protein